MIAGTVSGCEGWKEIKDFGELKLEWLRKFLPYKEGIPVDDTLARVMRKLDSKAFQTHFIAWMQSVAETTSGSVIAIDGKTLCGSHNRRDGKSAIHMVSVWSSENGLVLAQEMTSEKSNEITAIPELLDVLASKGCIVTIDAMGCQSAIADWRSKVIRDTYIKRSKIFLKLLMHIILNMFHMNTMRNMIADMDVLNIANAGCCHRLKTTSLRLKNGSA